MNIVVTGGAGFIGSHVVDMLIEEGHHVAVIDNLWAHGGGRRENLHAQAIFYQADICDEDYVYVRDVARSNLLALTRGSGGAYNIATGKGASVNLLFTSLCEIIGRQAEVIRTPKRPGDIYLSYFDTRKAADELAWSAQVDLQAGLRLAVDSLLP